MRQALRQRPYLFGNGPWPTAHPVVFGFLRSPVDLPSVSNPNDEDANCSIVDVADDPVFPHAVLPKGTQPGPLEGLPYAARVIQNRHACPQKSSDAPGDLLIHFGQGLKGLVIDLN